MPKFYPSQKDYIQKLNEMDDAFNNASSTLVQYSEDAAQSAEDAALSAQDAKIAHFVGEVRQVSFDTVPTGWLECDGTEYLIADYPLLFVKIGNAHGGDGVTTFAVPNLVSAGAGMKSIIAATAEADPSDIEAIINGIDGLMAVVETKESKFLADDADIIVVAAGETRQAGVGEGNLVWRLSANAILILPPADSGTPVGWRARVTADAGSVVRLYETDSPVAAPWQQSTDSAYMVIEKITNTEKGSIGSAGQWRTVLLQDMSGAQGRVFGYPADLATSSGSGSSIRFARADHVHRLPTKSEIGLGSVDNTSDADKPVSNAQQAALDLKLDGAEVGVTVAELVGGIVPDSQLPDYVAQSEVGSTVAQLVGGVVPDSQLPAYVADSDVGVTVASLEGGTVPAEQLPNSDSIDEGTTNLYHTDARVRQAALTGLDTSAAEAVTTTDTVLTGVGKLQAQHDAYLTEDQTIGGVKTFSDGIVVTSVNGGALGGFRNKFINGNFDIWQRGTSSSSSNTYLADRWQYLSNTSGGSTSSASTSQQPFAPGQTEVPGNPRYFSRIQGKIVGGTGAESLLYSQKIESVSTFAGMTVTVSLFARASSSRTVNLDYVQRFGTSGSASVYGNIGTLNLTTEWQRFEHTFTLPSITGKTVGDGDYLEIALVQQAGVSSSYTVTATSDASIDLAQAQIEGGAVATTFESRPYGLELFLCQRYYRTVPRLFGAQYDATGSTFYAHFEPMRATPTSTLAMSNLTLIGVGAGIGGLSGLSVGPTIAAVRCSVLHTSTGEVGRPVEATMTGGLSAEL